MTVEQNDFRYLMASQLPGTTQAQHMLGAVPLGIAAESAGNAFVILAGQFPGGKFPGLFIEVFNFDAIEVEPLFIHTGCSFLYSLIIHL